MALRAVLFVQLLAFRNIRPIFFTLLSFSIISTAFCLCLRFTSVILG